MKLFGIGIFFFIGIVLVQCKNVPEVKSVESKTAVEDMGYFSDYYVFIADDGREPLVVPIDINW